MQTKQASCSGKRIGHNTTSWSTQLCDDLLIALLPAASRRRWRAYKLPDLFADRRSRVMSTSSSKAALLS